MKKHKRTKVKRLTQSEQLLYDIYKNGVLGEDCNLTDYVRNIKRVLNIHDGERMTRGMVESATRQAYNVFDEWLDVTGFVDKDTSYYYEMQGIIEDAVHIGAQMAIYGNVKKDKGGEIVKSRTKEKI
jgi:hypothetical protein